MAAWTVILGVIVIAIGSVMILNWVYSVIKGWLPSSITAIGDKASAYVDQAGAAASLLSIALAAKKRKDTDTVALMGQAWQRVLLWDDAPVVVAVAPTDATAAAMAALTAEVAALKAKATA